MQEKGAFLQQAIKDQDAKMIQALLEGEMDPNNRVRNQITSLKLALSLGNREIVEPLIKYKALVQN